MPAWKTEGPNQYSVNMHRPLSHSGGTIKPSAFKESGVFCGVQSWNVHCGVRKTVEAAIPKMGIIPGSAQKVLTASQRAYIHNT